MQGKDVVSLDDPIKWLGIFASEDSSTHEATSSVWYMESRKVTKTLTLLSSPTPMRCRNRRHATILFATCYCHLRNHVILDWNRCNQRMRRRIDHRKLVQTCILTRIFWFPLFGVCRILLPPCRWDVKDWRRLLVASTLRFLVELEDAQLVRIVNEVRRWRSLCR